MIYFLIDDGCTSWQSKEFKMVAQRYSLWLTVYSCIMPLFSWMCFVTHGNDLFTPCYCTIFTERDNSCDISFYGQFSPSRLGHLWKERVYVQILPFYDWPWLRRHKWKWQLLSLKTHLSYCMCVCTSEIKYVIIVNAAFIEVSAFVVYRLVCTDCI